MREERDEKSMDILDIGLRMLRRDKTLTRDDFLLAAVFGSLLLVIILFGLVVQIWPEGEEALRQWLQMK